MKHFKKLPRFSLLPFVLLLLLFIQGQGVAHSQTKSISGIFHVTAVEGPIEVSFSFDPNGGPMVFESGSVRSDTGPGCYGTSTVSINGTFDGGDGGKASGTWTEVRFIDCGGTSDTKDILWTWSGTLRANGKGGGIASSEIMQDGGWTARYSASEFQAALQPVITSEYIYTTYGIRVEDSFGNDQYAQKAWSDHELGLLNDVLKELPPGFLGKISLTRIVRGAAYINNDGTPDPNVFGAYYPCDQQTDPKCTGSAPTIRIFDQAGTSTLDYPSDHDKQFKATILHEIIHAYQYHKDNNSIYKNPYDSPQTRNYMDATRPLKGENAHKWQNGWKWRSPPPKWTLYTGQNDVPPTIYGTNVNPLEDMSESVMMYVYDPARLKASSQARYDYIRDNLFEGVEYDNGQKK